MDVEDEARLDREDSEDEYEEKLDQDEEESVDDNDAEEEDEDSSVPGGDDEPENKQDDNKSPHRGGEKGSEENKQQGSSGKPSRGLTGYMLFLKNNRDSIKQELGEGKAGLKEVAKLAAEKWRALSEEERTKWNEDAKLVKVEPKAPKADDSEEEKVALPISKVREIQKKDPDVKNVQAGAVKMLAKATEMFTSELTKLALNCGDHKRIRLVDVHHIIHAHDDRFGFLAYDFETPAQIVGREERESRRKKMKSEAPEQSVAQAQGKGSIASYFTSSAKTERA